MEDKTTLHNSINKIPEENKNGWHSIGECCTDLNQTSKFSDMNNSICSNKPLVTTWGRGRRRAKISEIVIPKMEKKGTGLILTGALKKIKTVAGRGRGLLAHVSIEADSSDVSKLPQISRSLNKFRASHGIPVSLQAIESHLLQDKCEASNVLAEQFNSELEPQPNQFWDSERYEEFNF